MTPLTRRHFLRRLGVAAGATLGTSPLRELAAIAAPAPLHVVIAGAGLAGLCAALELERRGHTCTILEAESRHVGGRVRTLRFDDGLYGEAGAMRIPKTHTLTRHYVAELGLTLRPFVQSNPEAFVFMRGRRERMHDVTKLGALYGLAPGEQGKSPDDLWAASLGRRLEAMTKDERADLLLTEPRTETVRRLDRLSLRQLLEAETLSAEAIELLTVGAGVDTLLDAAATEHLREEHVAVWTQGFDEIVGGSDRLPVALATKLRSKPRMGAQVIRLEQDPLKRKAAAVYREAGRLRRVEGDFLLCTLPFPVLARIEVAPELSGEKRRAIRELGYDSATKILAVTGRRFWEQDDHIYGGGTYTDLPTGRPGIPGTTPRPAIPESRRRRRSSWPRTAGARRRGGGRRWPTASGASGRSVTWLAFTPSSLRPTSSVARRAGTGTPTRGVAARSPGSCPDSTRRSIATSWLPRAASTSPASTPR